MADSHLDQSERQQMTASAKALRHSDTLILFYWLALLYITVYSLKTAFPPCCKVQLEKVSLLNVTVSPIKMIHNMVQELTYPL